MSCTPCAEAYKEKLNTAFNEVIDSPEKFVVHPGKDFTRDRQLTERKVIKALHVIKGGSLNRELYDFNKENDIDATASAFVQQRSKLKPEAFEHIFKTFNAQCDDPLTYKGYRLLAVDGTELRISGQSAACTFIKQHIKEGGYKAIHLNALYDICNRTYRDGFLQYGTDKDEGRAALAMVKRCGLGKNDILIADRGYTGRNFVETLKRSGVFFLIRARHNFWGEMRSTPAVECDLDLSAEIRTSQTNEDKEAFKTKKKNVVWASGPSKKGKKKKLVEWNFESPCEFTYRFVKVELDDGKLEMLVTNLPREEFPIDELKKLYGMRWGIETSFRELKYSVGVINFHAIKLEHIVQEIWAHLTMHNFCERIARIAASRIKKSEKIKHKYQINFTMAIYICIDYFRSNHTNGPPDVIEQILAYILPVRPGHRDRRKEPKTKTEIYFMYRVA